MKDVNERAFLANVLRLDYAASDTTRAETVSGLGMNFDIYRNLNKTHYAATSADILSPRSPAFCVMQYTDGVSAAVAYDGAAYKCISMGFPFECIKNRQALLMQCLPAIKIVKCYCEVSHVNRGSDYAMYFLKKPSTAGMKMLSADRRCSSCTSTIRVDENPDSTSLPARWRSRSSRVVFPPPKRISRHFHGVFLSDRLHLTAHLPPLCRGLRMVCAPLSAALHISFLSAKEIGRAGPPRLEADKKRRRQAQRPFSADQPQSSVPH